MILTVHRTYEIFLAMRTHWNTQYDYVRYNGVLKTLSIQTFENDSVNFYKLLHKQYPTEELLVLYLIPCFLKRKDDFYYNYLDEEYIYYANNWYRKIQRLQTEFKKDCTNIVKYMKIHKVSFEDFFTTNLIFDFLIDEVINLETFIILNKMIKFLDKVEKKSIIYNNIYKEIVDNYNPFVCVDMYKYSKILQCIILQSKEGNHGKSINTIKHKN